MKGDHIRVQLWRVDRASQEVGQWNSMVHPVAYEQNSATHAT